MNNFAREQVDKALLQVVNLAAFYVGSDVALVMEGYNLSDDYQLAYREVSLDEAVSECDRLDELFHTGMAVSPEKFDAEIVEGFKRGFQCFAKRAGFNGPKK